MGRTRGRKRRKWAKKKKASNEYVKGGAVRMKTVGSDSEWGGKNQLENAESSVAAIERSDVSLDRRLPFGRA